MQRRVLSFKYAFAGLLVAIKEEPNLKIHFLIAIMVILISALVNISLADWITVIFLIGFVISLELTNSAIEAVVDAFTDKEHLGAKLAKDISAAAVLVAAISSAIIGTLIFLPYLT